jgi:hypothetical protein
VPIGIDESLRSVPDPLEAVRADAIGVTAAKVQRNAGLAARDTVPTAKRRPDAVAVGPQRDRPRSGRRSAPAAAFDIDPLRLNGLQYIDSPFARACSERAAVKSCSRRTRPRVEVDSLGAARIGTA